MEKIYEVTRSGKHIVPLILPYDFSHSENDTNEIVTYQKVTPNSFYEILDTIPDESTVYFNMLSRESTWWGVGKDTVKELYETIVENPLLLSINTRLQFSDFLATQQHGIDDKNKTGVSQEVVLGISYQNSNGSYTAIITVFGINANEFQKETVEFSGVHTRTDIINNIDHQHLPTSSVREFGDSGPHKTKIVKDPVTKQIGGKTPITDEFGTISAPLFGIETETPELLKYEMNTIISTLTVLYDSSITTAEALSEEI